MEFYDIVTFGDGTRSVMYVGFVDAEEFEKIRNCFVRLDDFLSSEDRGERLCLAAESCRQYGTSAASEPAWFTDESLKEVIHDIGYGSKYLPLNAVGAHTKDGRYWCDMGEPDGILSNFTVKFISDLNWDCW